MNRPGSPPRSSFTKTATSPPPIPPGACPSSSGEESYDAILNQWFSHYLYGLDNGVEDMAAVTAQSNTNTMEWNSYDSWKAEGAITLTGASAAEESASISGDYAAIGVDRKATGRTPSPPAPPLPAPCTPWTSPRTPPSRVPWR